MLRVQDFIYISVLSAVLTGCCAKPEVVEKIVIQKVLVQKPLVREEKIDMTGTYIELGSKEVQKMCTPSLLELNTVWEGVAGFYEWQVDQHNRRDINDTK